MTALTWYLTRILMRCISTSATEEPLFSEEFVLLKANDYEEACTKAKAKGNTMSHSYRNAEEQEVQWIFQSVLEVKEVMESDLHDGAEIYSKLCSSPPEAVNGC